jgi:hypothetical protein
VTKKYFFKYLDLGVKRNMASMLSVIEQWIERHTPDPSRGELSAANLKVGKFAFAYQEFKKRT